MFPFRSTARNGIVVAGSGTAKGAANPASVVGEGFAMARTGTGTYTITLQGLAAKRTTLQAFLFQCRKAGAATQFATAVLSSGVITVTTFASGGAAADLTDTHKFDFVAVLG